MEKKKLQEVPLRELEAKKLADIINSLKEDSVRDFDDDFIEIYFETEPEDFMVRLYKDEYGKSGWDIGVVIIEPTEDGDGDAYDLPEFEYEYRKNKDEIADNADKIYSIICDFRRWLKNESVDYDRYFGIDYRSEKDWN